MIDEQLSQALIKYLLGPNGNSLPYRSWSRIRDVPAEYRGQATVIAGELDYMLPNWHTMSTDEAVAQAMSRYATRYPQLSQEALSVLERVVRWTWR